MSIIIGKKNAIDLGKNCGASVYQISERRFCITNNFAWETGLISDGIWIDHRYMHCIYDPYKDS